MEPVSQYSSLSLGYKLTHELQNESLICAKSPIRLTYPSLERKHSLKNENNLLTGAAEGNRICYRVLLVSHAGVAQLVEQLICNQPVASSSLVTSFKGKIRCVRLERASLWLTCPPKAVQG